MKYLAILAVSLFALGAEAGGIWFEELPKHVYVGIHPLTGGAVSLQWENQETASLDASTLLGKASGLKKVQLSRNDFEAVFGLYREDELIAKVVTTGDCHLVRALMLVFPSGLSIPMRVKVR